MELMLQILFACPKCWRIAGAIVSSACFSLLMASLKLDRRVDKLESRFHVTLPDQVIDALPLATSTWEFVLLGLGILAGLYLIYFGWWLKRWV